MDFLTAECQLVQRTVASELFKVGDHARDMLRLGLGRFAKCCVGSA